MEDASDIEQLASAQLLTELILQDNRLTALPQLGEFVSLERLELSYNQIKSLSPLSALQMSPLQSLYAASNRLREVICDCVSNSAFSSDSDPRTISPERDEAPHQRRRTIKHIFGCARLTALWCTLISTLRHVQHPTTVVWQTTCRGQSTRMQRT